MSKSIKEMFIRFVVIFCVWFLMGFLWKSSNVDIETAFFIALGIEIFDFIIYMVRKYKNKKKIE
ncbi:hypothetical protein [Clostridium intestinale]|uniref:Uncharacterized protein n=1 Tax=Clostridium intestinale DSM 6191 TaxID=1121320 RepID=A0A1M5VVU9_9CLOT|nr:hypothetical protein [Clostridium intestinale]SHH79328.1 hypothetical protein SAMN02745941_00813 [Clostridium intestinale DSM 6191]